MRLPEAAQKNPVAVLAAAAILLLLAAVTGARLPLQLLPDLSPPQLSINSGLREAAPSEVEQALVEPQERVLSGLPGVTEMRSEVDRGSSTIGLRFALGTDMTAALIEVLNRLNRVYPPPPAEANRPQVSGGSNFVADNAATMFIRPLPGKPPRDTADYQRIVEDVVKPRLARIPGVTQVFLRSERPRQVEIAFDPYRAAALGLSVQRMSSAVAQARDSSAGFSTVGRRQFSVRFAGREPVAELDKLILGFARDFRTGLPGDRPILLGEVAEVHVGAADANDYTFRNGELAYFITLTRGNGANTVAIVDEAKKAIVELNASVLEPNGLTIELSFDASVYVRRAIHFLIESLAIGILLAVAGLWYFLRSPRPLLVVALTVPLSLAFALLALALLHRTLNVISLAGLAFSTGIVIDAALIVQGNIMRRMQPGVDALRASVDGAIEVLPALFAAMVTSVAIFLPVLFIEGAEGQLFADLAITMAVAHAGSLLVAMTVIPAANRWALATSLPVDQHQHWWTGMARFAMRLTDSPRARYAWIGALVLGGAALTLLAAPKTDYLPVAPQENLFAPFIAPSGADLEVTRREIAQTIIDRLAPQLPTSADGADGLIKYYNLFMARGGFNFISVYPRDPARLEELRNLLRKEVFAGLPDTAAFVSQTSLLSVDGDNPRTIKLHLKGANTEALLPAARRGEKAIAEALPGAEPRATPQLSLAQPELRLKPIDWRIARAGMDRDGVADALRALTSGLYVGEYVEGDRRLNLILRGPRWQSPEALEQLPLYTPEAGVQTVGDLAAIETTVGPASLLRIDGRQTIELAFEPPERMTVDEATRILRERVEPQLRALLPAEASIEWRGSASDLERALTTMARNFVLALLILFGIMAALFRSPRDSLIVLLVLPSSMAGGVIGLRLLGLFSFQALDLLTMIGFIILLGLVVNAAILLVDQTRALEAGGLPRRTAVSQALETRARPIVLSTLTAVLGMAPLMLFPGFGSEIYRGLAAVIIGGMTFGTACTWLLLPSLLRLGETDLIFDSRATAT